MKKERRNKNGFYNIATTGNSMAHADLRMSDGANASVATNISNVTLMDTQSGGSSGGLGVVSNGSKIFATYEDSPELVKYDSNGNYIWSTTTFTSKAWISVPMLSTDNNIIMADNIKIVRINNANGIDFDVSHGRNGSPVSPVLTSNGYIVLGLDNGEVVTNQVDNYPEGIKFLGLGSPIKNTPCVNGNSVFLSTDAGLKKVNILGDGTPSLEWTFDGVLPERISKSGGASPLFLNGFVYFDAKSGLTFKLYKVNAIDKSLGFAKILPVRLPASVAQSPTDNTMWYYPVGFKLEHIDENGTNLGNISIAKLGGVPSSVITIASNNVLIVRSGLSSNAAVTAIDLNNNTRLWRVGEGTLDTWGQFAIVNQEVFCTTSDQRLFKLS